MNPRRTTQKVAVGTINGLPGRHKFHFRDIPENWIKVDVREALHPKTALMYPSDDADQNIVADTVGSAALWDQKHIKIASWKADRRG
jgi:hypothetical protein